MEQERIIMEIDNKNGHDLLEREKFHKNLAEVINWQDMDKNGFVIGLYGSWGSGKTFSLTESLKILNEEYEPNIKNVDEPLIIHFNPWYFTETDDLILSFFGVLSGALKDKQSKLKNITECVNEELFDSINDLSVQLNGYFEKIMALSIPLMNPALLGMGLVGKKITKKIQKNYESFYNIVNLKENLNKKFKKLPFKIIVVMDDIDRLNDKEICQIFHLAKCLADFKNVTYVLSFDEKIVSNALENCQKGYGMHYLEKIVQFPIKMPQPHGIVLENILEKELKKIVRKDPKTIPQYHEFYHLSFSNMLNNVRDVNRYLAMFNFNHNLLKGKVNEIDLIILTSLQVFTPEIYDWIKNNKKLFVGYSTSKGGLSSNNSDNSEKDWFLDVEERLNNKYVPVEDMYELLARLFPNSPLNNINNTSPKDGDLENRIYGENSFETYFLYDKSEYSLTNLELNFYKTKNLSEQDFLGFLRKLSKENRLELYISKLCNSPKKMYKTPKNNIKIISDGLISSLNYVSPYDKKRISCEIFKGLYNLVATSKNPENNTKILINSLKKSEDSYLILDKIIYKYREKPDEPNNPYLSEDLHYVDFNYIPNEKLVKIIKELYDDGLHYETIKTILSGINNEKTQYILEKVDKNIILECILNVKHISGMNIFANLTNIKLKEMEKERDEEILEDIEEYLKSNELFKKYNLFKNQQSSINPQKSVDYSLSHTTRALLNSQTLIALNEPEMGFILSKLDENNLKRIASPLQEDEGPKIYEKVVRLSKLKYFLELDEISPEKINFFIENTPYYKNQK
ncbi:putative KAP-like P-loop ATPase [Methanococcus voltae]|uniref:Putative KAP-like P-loop ATPase n=1 Tax=Methanococcus voltae TaxID=2188 RepID=A0A8J7RNJ5_METVO|nr:P-loop NTPase fold protein [Methanococcus voltae]MBP2202176.1 putative KAP-like P-loop ATPase [Methanococcus voltae]